MTRTLPIRLGDANKDIKKIVLLLALFIFMIPILSMAENPPADPPLIATDCGTWVNGKINRECGYEDLLGLINRVINWIIVIAVPVAAGVFAWAGLNVMLNSDNPGKRSEGIKMMRQVFVGLVFILAAWLIVGTILNALLSEEFPRNSIPVEINLIDFNKSYV